MPAVIERSTLVAGNRGNPGRNSGNFDASRRPMPISFHKEIGMTYPLFPLGTDIPCDPTARLDALIADARAAMIAADAEAPAITAEIAAIEPHPHAHGHTAAGDCKYASIQSQHFLPLAGALAQPWPEALGTVETIRTQQGFDYLQKAFPGAFATFSDMLVDDGALLIEARADRINDDLTNLSSRKPMLATGMIFRLFGFDCRNRDAWVGTFAYGAGLSALIAATGGVADATMFGDALAAVVAARHVELSAVGARELHGRAARRDAERQASWAEVDEDYRQNGSWRDRAPTRGQRYMMQRIEAARSLPMPIVARRGASSDAITDAGGNPRFDTRGEEKA